MIKTPKLSTTPFPLKIIIHVLKEKNRHRPPVLHLRLSTVHLLFSFISKSSFSFLLSFKFFIGGGARTKYFINGRFSPSIDPFFDPLVGLDFEIESNSISNHMMADEKKDTVMDIISWKPREEGDTSTHGSHIGLVTIALEFTTENVSAHGSHIGLVAQMGAGQGMGDIFFCPNKSV
ncbi:uncharacterized protein LOC131300201 [Rhododendron vialii]|uniref:uncharacterized protein LOC131300201 n=1 Tax=Rhododendron vialii TaxID=182163 RepID=UPI00265E7B63|nr:uncharacterized protein LOC131300201 [Rhododendron vialii]